jgi:hypothetical protein
MSEFFPETAREQAKSLENVLLAACRGDRSSTGFYQRLREALMSDHALRPLLPEFVRTCRPDGVRRSRKGRRITNQIGNCVQG